MRLGMSTRREIYEAHYRRYQKAGKGEKGKILSELTGTTGLNRDHLAHVPASYGKQGSVEAEGKGGVPRTRRKQGPGKRGGRPPNYQDAAFIRVLTRIGEDHGRPWGKLLAPMIRGMIDLLVSSREPDYGITEGLKALRVRISGAPIDRLLAPAREVSTTRAAGASLRSPVPVPTRFDRKTVRPGDFAFDTVAHADLSPSGAAASGQFCKTYALNQPLFRLGGGTCPAEPCEQVGGTSHRSYPQPPALPPVRRPL